MSVDTAALHQGVCVCVCVGLLVTKLTACYLLATSRIENNIALEKLNYFLEQDR